MKKLPLPRSERKPDKEERKEKHRSLHEFSMQPEPLQVTENLSLLKRPRFITKGVKAVNVPTEYDPVIRFRRGPGLSQE